MDLFKADNSTRLKKEAVALLDVINLSFQSEAARSWDETFVATIVELLGSHPVSAIIAYATDLLARSRWWREREQLSDSVAIYW
mgnify:CR=1 FL=1